MSMSSNQIAREYDAVFAASQTEAELNAVVSGIDFTPMSAPLVAYITASYENALARVRRAAAQPKPHTHRLTVIDRALAKNIMISDDDVRASQTLREVALDYVKTYKGHSSFVQDIAVKLSIYGNLTPSQMRGALNSMVREARQERAAAQAEREAAVSADSVYIDLRSREDKERDAAGTAPVAASGSETAHRVPNGWYTVLIDGDPNDYVTIRLTDAPDHFNAAAGTQIAAYLNGPDNTSDYAGFAFVYGDSARPWKKAQHLTRQIRALGTLISADPMVAAAEYVKRSNRCFVCNRPLTTPASIAAGIGPVCAKNLAEQGFAFALMGSRDEAAETVTLEHMIAARVKHTRQTRASAERPDPKCETCLGDGETPDDDLAAELSYKGALYVPCADCMPQAYKAAVADLRAQADDRASRSDEIAGRADVLASRQRRAAAKAGITQAQAQADMDELFPE